MDRVRLKKQGNVMAIYKRSIRNDAMEFELTEQHIYGSTRLGVDRRNVDMIAAATPNDNGAWQVKRGEKHYELSNHLGNVLATVSDKKIAVMNGANLSYYRADVVSYSDYYPFGAPMTERTASLSDVRYGFQGQEEDNELWNGAVSFKYRVEDARLGRFFSVDPLSSKFPWNSSYAFSENRLNDGKELEGLEVVSIGESNTGTFLLITGTTEAGALIGPNGISGYATGGYGLDTDIAGGSIRLSVTIYPDMPSIYDACGEGSVFAIGTGDYGISAAIGVAQSGLYTGINLQFGVGLGLSPVSISYVKTETRISSDEPSQALLKMGREKLSTERNNLLNANKVFENDLKTKKEAIKSDKLKIEERNELSRQTVELQEKIKTNTKLIEAIEIGIKEIDKKINK